MSPVFSHVKVRHLVSACGHPREKCFGYRSFLQQWVLLKARETNNSAEEGFVYESFASEAEGQTSAVSLDSY